MVREAQTWNKPVRDLYRLTAGAAMNTQPKAFFDYILDGLNVWKCLFILHAEHNRNKKIQRNIKQIEKPATHVHLMTRNPSIVGISKQPAGSV
ncbi:MAG: hypothetical protein V7703_07570 [Hyphomicrobiales bacterium]